MADPKLGTAYVDVDGDFDKLVRGSKDAARKVNHHLSGLGKVALGAGLVSGGVAFGRLAKVAVGSASDINESLTKNQVLFGRYSKGIEALGDRSARSFGTSKAALLEYTGTFGNLFRALGVGQKESAKYSGQLTQLAADMASFNNTSIDEALEAIRSGLVGETEPLRKFGVNLNDATLRQEAMSLGLTHTTKSVLTPYQKAMASQALIVKQTAAAHGDFARTSGGLANQQRILKATFDDITAALGKELLPAAKDVTKGFADLGGDVEKIFQRKDLDFGDKIDKSIGAAKLDLGPVANKLQTQLKSAELGDKIEQGVEALAPHIASGVAHSAPRAAKAFGDAFIHADVWGQVLTGAVLYKKFGPAIGSAGKLSGRRFGGAFGPAASLVIGDYLAHYLQSLPFVQDFEQWVADKVTGVDGRKLKIQNRQARDRNARLAAEGDAEATGRGVWHDHAGMKHVIKRYGGRPQKLGGSVADALAQSPDIAAQPLHHSHRRRRHTRRRSKLSPPHAPSGRTLGAVNIVTNIHVQAKRDPQTFARAFSRTIGRQLEGIAG